MPYVITGDLNIRFDRPEDPTTLRVTELTDMFDAVQSVRSTTQDRGGILDIVIIRVEDTPSVADVIRIPGGTSDHWLVTWPFVAATAETLVYITNPGDSSTLKSSDRTLPPVFVMAHWVHLLPTALLLRPSSSSRSSRIYLMPTR